MTPAVELAVAIGDLRRDLQRLVQRVERLEDLCTITPNKETP